MRRVRLALILLALALGPAGAWADGKSGGTSSGAGTPGGADTQVQFNDGGAFGGDAAATLNKTEKSFKLMRPQAACAVKGNTGAAPAPNMREGSCQLWDLDQNATMVAPTNPQTDDVASVRVCNAGSFTFAPWSITWEGGSPVMPTGAGECLRFWTRWNGSAWVEGVWRSTKDVSYPTTATDDSVPVGDGTNYVAKVIPDCDDSVGQHLNYDTATNAFSCGTSTSGGLSGLTSGKVPRATGATTLADGSITDDGTNPTFPTGSKVTAGTGSGTATLVGALKIDTTSSACTGAGAGTDESILTYSLPANSLSANNKGVRITAWSTAAANGNDKGMGIKFGGTQVTKRSTAGFPNTGIFKSTATVIRTGAATQIASGETYVAETAGANWGASEGRATTPGETLSGAVTIAVTVNCNVASDVTVAALIVEMLN